MAENQKGFTLVEVLIATAISLMIMGAIMVAYMASVKTFNDVKSISDNLESKTPSIELIARYFDRWGVGVVSQADNASCTNCPAAQRSVSITTTNGCSDVTFYGNLYGMGFVQSVSGGAANIVSCRLATGTNNNCYLIWRNNAIINTITGGMVDPVSVSSLSSSNADCSALAAGTTSNVTASSTMSTLTVQAGDVIQRAWHTVRLYCANNSNDSNRKWLYVDLTDNSNGYCNDAQSAMPVAPVESFTATALPVQTGCVSTTGGTACRAVNVNITFRSQTRKAGGTYDTYTTANKTFGR
ncbi:MAG: prepilin-type N-terminal cleavage/methylation domain-containing protein [Nitrospirae bacterium]|nr:MAG: prepilin-type N-terminal cleavage/methylation domain-containing protein [Nitrospirota bacterium]